MQQMTADSRQSILIALGLALLGFALYANTLGHDFVLDDTRYIRDNYLLHDLSNIPLFFNVPPDALVEDLAPGFLRGRNIRWLTYAVDFAVGKGRPSVFHLSNILWHLLSGTFLFLFLRRWLSPLIAGAAVAVFLAHPIQTAAVAYISGRKDILATFFLLLTLLALARFRESGRYAWLPVVAGLFTIAFYSKEVAVVLPLLLLWGDLCRDPQPLGQAVAGRLRRHWPEYLLLSSLAGFFAWRQVGSRLFGLFTDALSDLPATAHAATLNTAIANAEGNLSFANLMLFYFGKLLLPVDLIADYRGVFSFSSYPAGQGWLWTPIFLGLLLALLFWLRRPLPAVACGLGWVFLALLPVSHLIDFHYPVAEHYLYLSCAGFALAIGGAAEALKNRFGSKPVLASLLLLLAVYGVATVSRNRDWQNMETITLDILRKAPQHPGARSTLVHLYMEQGRDDEALAQALEVLRQNPSSAVNHYNLGILYSESGEIEKAVHHYRLAIRLHGTLWDAYLNLGDLLLNNQREAQGLETISQLLSRYGYHPLAFYILGNHQGRKGEWKKALEHYRRAAGLAPTQPAAFLGMAGSFWRLGDIEEGKKILRQAFSLGLDLNWAREQQPWGAFFNDAEVLSFLNTLDKETYQ